MSGETLEVVISLATSHRVLTIKSLVEEQGELGDEPVKHLSPGGWERVHLRDALGDHATGRPGWGIAH